MQNSVRNLNITYKYIESRQNNISIKFVFMFPPKISNIIILRLEVKILADLISVFHRNAAYSNLMFKNLSPAVSLTQ